MISVSTNDRSKIRLAVIILLAFVSCQDHDEPPLSAREVLTLHEQGWIVSFKMTNTVPPVDLWNQPNVVMACFRDDAYVFNMDGTYQVESTVKCDPKESEILEEGTWSMAADDKQVNFTPKIYREYVGVISTVERERLTISFSREPGIGYTVMIPR